MVAQRGNEEQKSAKPVVNRQGFVAMKRLQHIDVFPSNRRQRSKFAFTILKGAILDRSERYTQFLGKRLCEMRGLAE
jgi:hypothetical protein